MDYKEQKVQAGPKCECPRRRSKVEGNINKGSQIVVSGPGEVAANGKVFDERRRQTGTNPVVPVLLVAIVLCLVLKGAVVMLPFHCLPNCCDRDVREFL